MCCHLVIEFFEADDKTAVCTYIVIVIIIFLVFVLGVNGSSSLMSYVFCSVSWLSKNAALKLKEVSKCLKMCILVFFFSNSTHSLYITFNVIKQLIILSYSLFD